MASATQQQMGSIQRYMPTVLGVVLTAVFGCGGGGGGGGGQTALQATAAAEASAGVAVSTIVALTEFRPINPSAAPRDLCADGGQQGGSCTVHDGQSRNETKLTDCHASAPDLGGTIFADGSYAYIVDDPAACTDGPAPGAPVTLDVRDYTWRLVDEAGEDIERFSGTYTQTTSTRGEGCAGLNDTRAIDGNIDDRSTRSGLDLSLTAEHLTLDIDSDGPPCAVRVAANGELQVDDHANDRRFGQVFGDAHVTFADGGLWSIDGDVANDCIGNVTFETMEPLRMTRADECPFAGLIKVRFDGGATAAIRFTDQGGLEVDYDDDGQPDKVVSSCHDAALIQCAG